MANGKFYSPFFYGQLYNNSLEGLLSAPFVAMGLQVEKVVPVISNLIGAVPFLAIFILLYRKKWYYTAIMFMTLAILLPEEYHLISSMARGFMGGLAVLAVGVLLITAKRMWLRTIGYFLSVISVFVNPNALVLLVPLSLYFLIEYRSELYQRRKELIIAVGTGIVVFVLLQMFKWAHHEYEVHKLWRIHIHYQYFWRSIQELDERFAYMSPTSSNAGAGVVILLIGLALWVFRRFGMHRRTLVAWAAVLFVAFTLFVNKTCDGSTSVFFPYSRMYLGLPFLYLFLYTLSIDKDSGSKIPAYILFIAAVWNFSQKDVRYASQQAVRTNSGHVQAIRTERLCDDCDEIQRIAHQFNADIIVFHNKTDEYTYGCVALDPTMQTLHPNYERRYWEFEKHGYAVYNRVLFMDWDLNLENTLKNHHGKLTALKNLRFPAYLLTENDQPLVELYTQNELELRPLKSTK